MLPCPSPPPTPTAAGAPATRRSTASSRGTTAASAASPARTDSRAWDVDDVVQATWVTYLEHGHELREPAALGAWLETTARRLSLRVLQRHVREQLTATGDPSATGGGSEPEPELLATERRAVLFGALAALPDRQRRLMRMLVLRPELSYEEVGRRLAMPVGSIGPTRARCLDRLRRDLRLRALQAA